MKKFLALTLAGLMLFSLVACGSGDSPGGPSGGGENTADPQASPTSSGLLSGVVEGNEADSYREHIDIALASQITTLNPGLVSNVQHYYLFNMVYNTLLYYDNSAKELSPELSTKCEWADDTYTKISVTLRDDMVFHNGEPMTAEDVAFSLDRTTSTLVTNSYDHCDVTGDYTLDIILKEANVDFLYVLSHNSSAIVSKKVVEADPDLGGAVGTGPWGIDMPNVVAGDTLPLLRNENYWSDLPETKTITLHYNGNASSRLIALQNGEVSMMTSVNPTE